MLALEPATARQDCQRGFNRPGVVVGVRSRPRHLLEQPPEQPHFTLPPGANLGQIFLSVKSEGGPQTRAPSWLVRCGLEAEPGDNGGVGVTGRLARGRHAEVTGKMLRGPFLPGTLQVDPRRHKAGN